MAYIQLEEGLYGIRGPMAFRPETAKPINELAEILLRNDDNSLSRGDRELIATYVSYLNDCFFCQNAHGALAQHYMECDIDQLDTIKLDFNASDISDKLKSLLNIAASVQKGGKYVTPEQIDKARALGATDKEIHDTVLISAFFCLCNRYVDGLNTPANPDRMYYVNRGKMRAEEGYVNFDLHR